MEQLHPPPPRKPFAVVLFEAESKYATVPSSWISEDKTSCAWPGQLTRNASALIQDSNSKPGSDWKSHKVTYVKFFETIERANIKCKKLKDKRVLDIDTSASEIDRPEPAQVLYNANQDSVVNYVDDIAVGEVEIPIQTLQLFPVEEFHALREELTKFQRITLQKQEEVLSELKDIKKLLRHQIASSSQLAVQTDDTRYPPLPLKTLDELTATEAIINSDQTQRNLLLKELTRVGGIGGISGEVYKVLRHLISPNLSKTVRYTNISGKTAFGPLGLAKCVRSAVQAHYKEATDSEIDEYVKKHFRNTNPRKLKLNGDFTENQKEED